jgi:hypothetical protein
MWGIAGDSDKTDTKGFYDKECAYTGTRAKGGSGADANEAATPAANYPKAPMEQTFTRDNEPKDFTVDLYVPTSVTNLINYTGTKAVSTSTTRWANGSPKPVTENDNKGAWFFKSSDAQEFFKKDTSAPSVQRNWEVTAEQRSNYGTVTGQHHTFKTNANWASDRGKPQVLQVKWEYEPLVANTIPTQRVGWAGPGGKPSHTLEKVYTETQGRVQSVVNAETSTAQVDKQRDNTGTGSTNGRETSLEFGMDLNGDGTWKQTPGQYSPYYSSIKFVRSVSE